MSYFLAPSLVQLRKEVNQRWPNRSKVSDGWIGDAAHSARKSDHNPDWSAPGKRRGVVRAIDITAKGIDVGLLLKHTTNDPRVAYVIYNRRIYTHARGWYRYTGSNPHTSHVHISVGHTAARENQTHSWFGSAPTSTSTSTKTASSSSTTTGQARTNRDKVPVHSHRDSSGDRQIDTLHKKGYRVNIVENPKGGWTRIRNSKGPGGNGWVATAHLDIGNTPKGKSTTGSGSAYPNKALPLTDTHTTASHNAWVYLMRHAVNRTDRNLTINIQRWLRDLGYYRGLVDGIFGPMTNRAMQRFLADRNFYSGRIDGVRGPMQIRGEIQYLNDQRQYLI